MSSINFDNVYLLFIMLPLAALFAIPFFIAVRKDNVNGHNVASGVLHIIMAVIIAFAAAGTSVITTVTETDVYVLADVSYSASRNLDAVDGYIEGIKNALPDNSRLGLVCFGNNYRMLTKAGGKLESVKSALAANGGTVDDGGTDIVSVLEYAGTLFKEGVVKRIVLITDGRQTNGAGAAELKAQVDALAAKKIHVDAIYLDDNLKENEQEVQLCSADFAGSVYSGSEQRASVAVRCNFAKEAIPADRGVQAKVKVTATVKDGEGEVLESKTYDDEYVELARGYTDVNVNLYTEKCGRVDYSVTLETVDEAFTDGNLFNNTLSFTQYVGGTGKTLFITQKEGDYAAVKELVGEDELDYYINTPDVPCSLEELCGYDRIILSSINLASLENSETFIESLSSAVSSFGKSLLTFGDVGVQSDGDATFKKLGDMLPIKFNSTEGGRLFTIVLDASHSMLFEDKLAHAGDVAEALLSLLNDDDDVTLIKFDGDAYPLEVGANVGVSRQALINDIRAITDGLATGQGTSVSAGLKLAKDKMESSSYGDKRLMLISDGNSKSSDTDQVLSQKVADLLKYDVQVSTFGVGSSAQNPNGVAKLKRIANWGGGTFYDVSTDEKAADVINTDLMREQAPAAGGRSYITVKRSGDSVLDGVTANVGGVYVNGFVSGKVRASATTVLTVKNQAGAEAPLYAYWNYGSGRVASFSSHIGGDSLKTWQTAKLKTTLYQPFFNNVITSSRPEEKNDAPFVVELLDNGGYADVEIIPYELRPEDSEVKLNITSDDGAQTQLTAVYANSMYAARFTLAGTGLYSIKITYTVGGKEYVAEKSLSVSYSPEYDSFAMYDEGVLQNAIGAHGTVSADGKLSFEASESEIAKYYVSLTMPLLIACVALYFVDIAVRKLKKEDIISLFKGVKKA